MLAIAIVTATSRAQEARRRRVGLLGSTAEPREAATNAGLIRADSERLVSHAALSVSPRSEASSLSPPTR
jgi:hypothetical protein